MASGIYIRTEEMNKHMSDVKRGISHSEEFKRKDSDAKKGNTYGKGNKGKHHSEEARRKMSEAHKGHIPWNKNKTGIYSDKTLLKISIALKGHSPSDITREKLSKAHWKGGRKEALRKANSKRRSFDCIPLNQYFEGSVAHHLDKVYVIHIPEEVHQSIWHSVLKNKNMDEINAIAFNYL